MLQFAIRARYAFTPSPVLVIRLSAAARHGVTHLRTSLLAGSLLPCGLLYSVVIAAGLVHDGLLRAALEQVLFADDEVRFGSDVDADRLRGLRALAGVADGICGKSEVLGLSLDAHSVAGRARAAIVRDFVRAEDVAARGVALPLIAEVNPCPRITRDDVPEKCIISVLVTQ